jgi:hypothetical protein
MVHALAKKAKDVKQSYGKRFRQLSLELEHLHGIILYERKHVKHRIDPLEFETHKQEWEKNNASLVFVQRQLDQKLYETQQKLEKTQEGEKKARETLKVL